MSFAKMRLIILVIKTAAALAPSPMEVDDAAPPTQADEPDAGTLAEEEFSEPWARLIGMGPTSSFGIVDLNQRVILFGKVATNSNAHIKFNDPRVSSMHCRIFLDDNGLAHVIDLSSNGTWWNNQRMGKNQIRRLQNADNIVLLNPNPKHASISSGNAMLDDPAVVPHAINYQFMFIDLRPPPPLPPPPPPLTQPSLLRETSLCAQSSAEDYEEVCELGKGSFAVVKRVLHRPTGIEYAMKVMDKKKLLRGAAAGDARCCTAQQMAELQSRVLMEARILRDIEHPNVIKFVDIFEDTTKLYLVMELVQGGELFDRLERDGPFAEADARHVMFQLLSALSYLHERHIVHRDLKPENILLKEPPAGATSFLPEVKIADFGLAKLVGADVHFRAATFCGTPQYFAPEVLETRSSGRGYDRACDVWSVGVLMYNLLSASPPFADQVAPPGASDAPATIFDQIKAGVNAAHFRHPVWDRVSPAAKQMICRMLVVDPRRRLSVAQALADPWMQGESRAFGSFRPWDAAHTRAADEIEDSDEEVDGTQAGRRGPRSKRQCSVDPRHAPPAFVHSGLTQHMAALGHGSPFQAQPMAAAAAGAPPPVYATMPTQPLPHVTAGAPRPPYAGFVVGAAPMAAVQPSGVQPGAVGHPAAIHVGSSVAAKLTSKPKTSRGAAAALAAAQQRRAVGPLTVNGGAGK